MKKFIFISLFLGLILSQSSFAQTNSAPAQPETVQQTIKLRDGTLIKGQLTAVKDGYYHIKTKNMGVVKVDQSEVYGIMSGPDQTGKPISQMPVPFDDPALAQKVPGPEMQLNSLYDMLLADPKIKTEIEAIVADPEIEQLLNNQDLLEAAFSMNPDSIQNNPNAVKLMQHPKMQRLMQIISEKLMSLTGTALR